MKILSPTIICVLNLYKADVLTKSSATTIFKIIVKTNKTTKFKIPNKIAKNILNLKSMKNFIDNNKIGLRTVNELNIVKNVLDMNISFWLIGKYDIFNESLFS